MSSEEEEVIYCICRSSDVSRFMIGCDHCEEWYHGDCINVTAQESKYIKKFFCKECRDKNPKLKVVYKSKYADKLKEISQASRKDKKEDHLEKKSKEKKKSKDKERERSKERHKHKDKKNKKDKDERKEEKKHKHKSNEEDERKEKKSKPVISDSDDNTETKDKDKDKERKKQEEEEKEKARLKEKELQKERHRLREEKRKEKEEERKKEESAERKRKEAKEKERKEKLQSTEVKPKAEPDKIKSLVEPKGINSLSQSSSEDDWKPAPAPPPPSLKRKPLKETGGGSNKRKRAWRPEYASSDDDEVHDLAPRQCYGMECANCARVGSKYCSDQCGLTVASLRIYQTLPERIREWNMTSCKAEKKNGKELESIRQEILIAKQRLEELDRDAEKLETTITKGKSMTLTEHNAEDSSDEDEEVRGGSGGAINCISCGKDIPSRIAIRHMESCFNKFESQTSFGSMYKTKIEGYQMFCDFFNPQTGTYCKRLRVICPEHTKDLKLSDSEVCGYPLTKNVFQASGEYCRLSRKACQDHYCWEKLKRAELDMDRVRQWLKLDELLEKERQEKESMSRRAGVLNLLLHSTFNHELAKLMQQKKNRTNPPPPAKPQKRV